MLRGVCDAAPGCDAQVQRGDCVCRGCSVPPVASDASAGALRGCLRHAGDAAHEEALVQLGGANGHSTFDGGGQQRHALLRKRVRIQCVNNVAAFLCCFLQSSGNNIFVFAPENVSIFAEGENKPYSFTGENADDMNPWK